MKDKIDLAEWIKANPGATFTVDNDEWYVVDENGKIIIDDGDVIQRGSGYGSGHCYGGDILQALAEIVGVKIESV